MGSSKKRLVSGMLVFGLLCGSTGVYAGTLVERYKTPRGNIATVETEQVHKNRIGITVNGKTVKADTIYFNQTTYAPIREVANMLNAGVNYNSKTMSADIFTKNELLDLYGIKLNKGYVIKSNGSTTNMSTFVFTSFNPSTNEFEAQYSNFTTYKIKGYLTEKKMVWTSGQKAELVYNATTKTFVGERFTVTIE